MSSWSELLIHAGSGAHLVQLYGEDDQLLTKNVSRFFAEGLRRSDGLLVVATPEHVQAIVRQLGEETAGASFQAEREGRLVCLDARTTLDRILESGRPDRALFDTVIGEALQEVRSRAGSGRVRAFGEMVSLLWTEARFAEAELLEGLWNALLSGSSYSLYCAYRIDLFSQQVDNAALHSIVGAHTHLLAGPRTMFSNARINR